MAWNDERIAKLRHGWEHGMTATQIAEMLGEGVTRNAVIGKAHRLGLQSRPSPVKNSEAAPALPRTAAPLRPAAAPAPAGAEPIAPPPAAPVPEPAAVDAPAAPPPALAVETPPPAAPARQAVRAAVGKPARTSLLDLNDKVCKWPIGHPGEPDFHFCGRPVQPGFPYCGEHCLVAYQAQMPRRDRPRPLPPLPGAPRR